MLNNEKLDLQILELPESERLLVNTYVQEAYFYFQLLEKDLAKLSKKSNIIEIGSGIGLLSLLIAEIGHSVIAFEPESSGFDQMLSIRKIILSCWEDEIPEVKFINDYFSHKYLGNEKSIDYFLAINVIEHMITMSNVEKLLSSIKPLLDAKSIFRVICPNYLIPYEPHFDIPTVINKKATFFLFKKFILKNNDHQNQEMWNELSWPTQDKLQKTVSNSNLSAQFSRDATVRYLTRPFLDASFKERKGKFTFYTIKFVSFLLIPVISLVPRKFMPVLDCSIKLSRS